jgi:hypothetical protein
VRTIRRAPHRSSRKQRSPLRARPRPLPRRRTRPPQQPPPRGPPRSSSGGNWVIVKAKLPSRAFVADKRTNYYHHGLTAKTEVKIQSKPCLVTLLPALDKYIR